MILRLLVRLRLLVYAALPGFHEFILFILNFSFSLLGIDFKMLIFRDTNAFVTCATWVLKYKSNKEHHIARFFVQSNCKMHFPS